MLTFYKSSFVRKIRINLQCLAESEKNISIAMNSENIISINYVSSQILSRPITGKFFTPIWNNFSENQIKYFLAKMFCFENLLTHFAFFIVSGSVLAPTVLIYGNLASMSRIEPLRKTQYLCWTQNRNSVTRNALRSLNRGMLFPVT